MADFMKYLEDHNAMTFFKAQIDDLSEFIKDIEVFTHIEVEAGELESLKTYLEECEKRLQCLNEYITMYEERKGEHDSTKTKPQTTEGT